jgi:hypothetical protein
MPALVAGIYVFVILNHIPGHDETPPMTKRAFDKIKAGLDDAKAFLEGIADKKPYRLHVPRVECEGSVT